MAQPCRNKLKFLNMFQIYHRFKSFNQPAAAATPKDTCDVSKKRKRSTFSPKTLKSLNDAFNKNSTPSSNYDLILCFAQS